MGVSSVERFADPARRNGPRHSELVETLSEMVQDGHSRERFLDRGWKNHPDVY